jgi:hypothetical protein
MIIIIVGHHYPLRKNLFPRETKIVVNQTPLKIKILDLLARYLLRRKLLL